MPLTPSVLLDVRTYFDSLDVTGFSNKVEFDSSAEDLDRTTFADGGAHARVGGLFDSQVDATVFWQATDLTFPDDAAFAELADATAPLTMCPTSGAVGTVAYLTKVMETAYKPGGSIGDLFTADLTWMGTTPVARGQIIHPQGTARTSTGTGTAVQLGPVLLGQRMYVNLHVLSVAGTTPSITVALQSAPTSGFASPTVQATFGAVTSVNGLALSSAVGPITDQWWRASWTITGTTPSFLFAVSAGVANK